MLSRKVLNILWISGIVLFTVAFVLEIVSDILLKNDVLSSVIDKIVWIVFGSSLGVGIYVRRHGKDGKQEDRKEV